MVEMDTTPDSPVPQPDEPLLSPAAPVESTAIEQDAIYESGAPLPSPALPASTDAPNSISASPAPTAALVSLADPLPPANPAQPTEFLSTSPGGKSRTWTAKYYLPVSSSHPASSARNQLADLPESYFAPTAGELQGAFNGLEKKRMELVDRPLLTRMLREKEEEGKKKVRADRWPQTRIRVRFGDRSQLEGVFSSTETLISIYEFVKFALVEEYRSTTFLLYQTPPRQEFAKTDAKLKGKSLMDLQLTPSSVFYIKFSDESLNHSSTPPLIPVLLAAAGDFPLPPPFDPTSAAAPTTTKKVDKIPNTTASGKVMPNWMRKAKSGK